MQIKSAQGKKNGESDGYPNKLVRSKNSSGPKAVHRYEARKGYEHSTPEHQPIGTT